MADKHYIVTAPSVIVKTVTRDGPRIISLSTGAQVPADADEGWVKTHLDTDMIVEVADPAQAAVAPLTPLEAVEPGANAITDPGDRVRKAEKERAKGKATAQEGPQKDAEPSPSPDEGKAAEQETPAKGAESNAPAPNAVTGTSATGGRSGAARRGSGAQGS